MKPAARESFAVVARRHSEVALEGHPHALLIAKAALRRDLVDVACRGFQQAPRWCSVISKPSVYLYELARWRWLTVPWTVVALIGTATAFIVSFRKNNIIL